MFVRMSLVASFFTLIAIEPMAFAEEPLPIPNAPAPGRAPAAVPITATCSLGDHPGIDDSEAHAAAEIVC